MRRGGDGARAKGGDRQGRGGGAGPPLIKEGAGRSTPLHRGSPCPVRSVQGQGEGRGQRAGGQGPAAHQVGEPCTKDLPPPPPSSCMADPCMGASAAPGGSPQAPSQASQTFGKAAQPQHTHWRGGAGRTGAKGGSGVGGADGVWGEVGEAPWKAVRQAGR